MKNILILLIITLTIIFSIPLIFIKKSEVKTTYSNIENNEEVLIDNKYKTVKLLHTSTGEIESIDLEDYISQVVSAEIPASFEEEAIKAQAVVARTYTLYNIIHSKHMESDICDSPNCCQAWMSKEKRMEQWSEQEREIYWEKIDNAIESTKGEVVTYNGEIINSVYHANSGGITENASNVWGGNEYPYLQSVETFGEEDYNQYYSELNISFNELENKLKERYTTFSLDENKNLEITGYTDSGRVKEVKIGNINISGIELRNILELKSNNFEIFVNNDDILFNVKGYGHGVGMSQTGADSLAKQGYDYLKIIEHYYTGVKIISINRNDV